MQEVRCCTSYGSLKICSCCNCSTHITGVTSNSPQFQYKLAGSVYWNLEGSYYVNPKRQMRILFEGAGIFFTMGFSLIWVDARKSITFALKKVCLGN